MEPGETQRNKNQKENEKNGNKHELVSQPK